MKKYTVVSNYVHDGELRVRDKDGNITVLADIYFKRGEDLWTLGLSCFPVLGSTIKLDSDDTYTCDKLCTELPTILRRSKFMSHAEDLNHVELFDMDGSITLSTKFCANRPIGTIPCIAEVSSTQVVFKELK